MSVLVGVDYAQLEVRLYSTLSGQMNGIKIPSSLEQMASDWEALGFFMEVLAATPLLDLGALQGWQLSFRWDSHFYTWCSIRPDGVVEQEWYAEYANPQNKSATSTLLPGAGGPLQRSEMLHWACRAWEEVVIQEREALGRSWQNGQQAADP